MSRRRSLRFWWPVLAVIVAGLASTGFMVQLQRDLEQERQGSARMREATAVIDAVRDRLSLVEERLIAVRSLFAAAPDISREQFTAYVEQLLETRLALESIEWAPRVQRPGPEDAFPVAFIAPFSGHAPKPGIDLAADPRWGAALQSARDSGRMTAVELAGTGKGMLVLVPVFTAEAATDSIADRHQALRGFVIGLIRLEPLVRLAVATRNPDFDVLLRSVPGGSLTVVAGAQEASAPLSAEMLLARPGVYSLTTRFDGMDIELIAAPSVRAMADADGTQAWNVLVLGLLATVASAVVAALLRSSKRRVLDLVAERTRALRESRAALEESQERLHLALVGARLWAWDWNVPTDQLIWFDPPEPMLGPMPPGGWPDFRSLVHPDDYSFFIAAGRASLEQGQPYRCEFRVRRTDGGEAWVASSGTVLCDAGGKAERLIGVSLDITERKNTEANLRQARDAAEAASSAKTRFLATMSHEIRTPMNGVLGMAELLKLSGLNEEQHEYVRILLESGNSLMAILNDILDYSRIESGRLDLEIAPFEPALLGRNAIQAVAGQAQRRGLALALGVAAGLAPRLLGDEARIGQILSNLLSNALKFTDQGRVALRLMPATADGTGLRVEVTDSGIGIPPQALDTLFQPFSQVDSSITRRFGGTGLGLAICKRMVEGMHGRIGVDTVLGEGSMFWFELPLKVIEPAGQNTHDSNPEGGNPMSEDRSIGDAPNAVPCVFDASVLKEVTEAAGIAPEDLVDVFLTDAEQSLKRIAEALAKGAKGAKGDADLANRLAHSMKSSAANVGAMRLSVAARALEVATKPDIAAEAEAKLAIVTEEVASFRRAVFPART